MSRINKQVVAQLRNRKTEYERVIDCLNYIDEQAERGDCTYSEQKTRAKAYEVVANFIDKKAKR